MKALVTGATGFIGGNLVKALLSEGYEVRALIRKESPRHLLSGLNVELAFGDLRDKRSLEEALDGCDVLFHVAAVYSFWSPDPSLLYETNVTGTANLLSSALAKGIGRVVYTSSESTLEIPKSKALGTEERLRDPSSVAGHYKTSKLLAEKLALEICREGLPLVVVNPTTPVGPGDVKPTPTGQLIVDFLNRRMPAYVDTGLNLVDVEDVAKGHILALERGRVGERYILGNRNIPLGEIFKILEGITGIKAPRLKIPLWLAMAAGYVDELIEARAMRRRPRIPLEAVKTARSYRYFDCSKAVRELGLPQTPIEEALEKAVRWFRQNGYAS